MRKSCFFFFKKKKEEIIKIFSGSEKKDLDSEPQKIALGLSVTPKAEAAAVLVLQTQPLSHKYPLTL